MNKQIRNNDPQFQTLFRISTGLVLKHNFDSPVMHVTGPENHDERDGVLPEEICSTDEEC